MSKGAVLVIEPNDELRFDAEVNAVACIKMTNVAARRVHFKLKTTAPKHYFVRPNSGLIEPGGSCEARIALQALKIDSKDRSRHKFMIQFIQEPPDVTMPPEQLWANAPIEDVMKYKLRCVFAEGDDSMDSSVQEDLGNTVEDVKKIAEEVRRLREEEAQLRREHLALKAELKSMSEAQMEMGTNGVPMYVISLGVLMAILAFFVGKFS